MNIQFICVDFQKDFSDPKGMVFTKGESSNFIKNQLVCDFKKRNIKVSEIISDYRDPSHRTRKRTICIPGTRGYESDIPKEIKKENQWIKSANSPLRTRENIGNPHKIPGLPYQDPQKFDERLKRNIGQPNEVDMVILFGLTMDVCIFCTAQELYWRGYHTKILYEATDPMRDAVNYKQQLATSSPLLVWAGIIHYDELLTLL